MPWRGLWSGRLGAYKAVVIGLGRIASTIDDEVLGTNWMLPFSHAGSYREVPEVTLAAAADLHPDQRRDFAARYELKESQLFEDYRAMITEVKPHIVSVCTNAKHRHAVVMEIARMRAGVRVIWAEKPISVTLREADEMVAACREAGIALAINNLRRWHPWYVQARKLIDDGVLGEIRQVSSYQRGKWSNTSHMVDLARFMGGGDGRVQWVFGEMESDEAAASDQDISGVAFWRFASGAHATLRTVDTGQVDELDTIGSEGRIRASNNGVGWEFWRKVGEGRTAEFALHQFPRPQWLASPGAMAVRDFIEVIETGKQPNCTGEDGVAHLDAILAARESHRRGGVKIELPLADRSLGILSSELKFELPRAVAYRMGVPGALPWH
ncbi:MAG: Gfo/Idh/MocA family oxidoreductase [Chloroflexi bacterium]|nr:Gfo/Idh/MocA family oxidoreductase [Chloroflexota bacterium]